MSQLSFALPPVRERHTGVSTLPVLILSTEGNATVSNEKTAALAGFPRQVDVNWLRICKGKF